MSSQNPTAAIDNKHSDEVGGIEYSNASVLAGLSENSNNDSKDSKQKQKKYKANIKLKDQEAQGTDSGFISGPLSSFCEEPGSEQAKKIKQNTVPKESKENNLNKLNRNNKQVEEELSYIDSGCIVEEESGEEENDNTNGTFAKAEHKTNSHNQQQNNNKSSALNIESASDKKMKLEHNVDVHMSERFCNITSQGGSINNLNTPVNSAVTEPETVAGAGALPTKPSKQLPPWEQYYQQNDDGDTYLHLACLSGHENVVVALIRVAIHPYLLSIKNDCGQTPLHLAALSKQKRILRMLLLAGAEPNLRDCYGNTALHLACMTGDDQCVNALIMPFSPSEISEAQRQFNVKSNHKVLNNLEIRNYDGEFCVHIAAEGGHIKILRLLIHYGASINAKEGKGGYTPLHISIEKCNKELFKFLIDECKHKLNLETETFGRLTAYQFACILKRSKMQSILENQGAELLTPPFSEYENSDDEFE